MKNTEAALPTTKFLVNNTLINLLGQAVPLLVAVFAIPPLVHGLGTARFGLLTIAWVVIGYFGLFDLGLGRALTQLVAEKHRQHSEETPALVWTSLASLVVLGLVGLVVMVALAPLLATRFLNVPHDLRSEAVLTFYVLALSIPFVVTTSGLRGVLEALQRFDLINLIRVPTGLFVFVGPLLVLPFTHNLAVITAVLLVNRIVGWALHLVMCFRVLPELRYKRSFERSVLGQVVRFGSWMTVTNVVGPLMVTLDRFLIGAVVSVAAVSYYATPYEVVTKLWIIPGAVVGVLFPAFASSFSKDENYTSTLFSKGVKYTFLILFPVTLVIVSLAPNGLEVWLGADFARNSTAVMRLLAVGVLVNSLAQVPFAYLQGIGRPDITAKLHLFELPLYIGTVFFLLKTRGIEGAALAWTARVLLDTVLLFAFSSKYLVTGSRLIKSVATLLALALAVLAVSALPSPLPTKLFFLLAALTLYCVLTWLFALNPGERSFVKTRVGLTQPSSVL